MVRFDTPVVLEDGLVLVVGVPLNKKQERNYRCTRKTLPILLVVVAVYRVVKKSHLMRVSSIAV